MQAIILQGQVKAQAEKDVANYEAEWHKLTEIIEQDRTSKVGGEELQNRALGCQCCVPML